MKGSTAPFERILFSAVFILILSASVFIVPRAAEASYHFSNYKGTPPIHVLGSSTKSPVGMTPSEIKTIYHLQQSGGHGTIAIIGAYDDKTIEADLATFSK